MLFNLHSYFVLWLRQVMKNISYRPYKSIDLLVNCNLHASIATSAIFMHTQHTRPRRAPSLAINFRGAHRQATQITEHISINYPNLKLLISQYYFESTMSYRKYLSGSQSSYKIK